MQRRAIAGALGLAVVLVLLPSTFAFAEYRGSDMWSQLVPGGVGGLVDRYPISHYSLDYHVDGPSLGFSGASVGDPVALVAQFAAAFLFMIATFFMRVAIEAFNWAFNIDIINGHDGALTPVGHSTQAMYLSTFKPLFVVAALIFGGWLVAKILNRRFGEAAAGTTRAVLLCAAALAIIFNPADTIGRVASLTKDLSAAVVSGSTGGNGGVDVADRIFKTFIYQPWVVIEFGGLRHCVNPSSEDSDGFPLTTGPHRTLCRDHVVPNSAGYGGYASRFLTYAPGSKERNMAYEAMKDGKEGSSTPTNPGPGRPPAQNHQSTFSEAFPGWHVDKADAPGVDNMQAGGAMQRLGYTVLLCIGIASAILLLGLLCAAALFAQLGLLVLYAFTPVMVIAAIFPAAHGIVVSWGKWIFKLLIANVIYALMLAAAVGVSDALMSAGGQSGYLLAFMLQTVLFMGLFIKRKALSEMLTSRREYSRGESGFKSLAGNAATGAITVAAAPASAAAAVTAKKLVDRQEERQEAARKAEREAQLHSTTDLQPAPDGRATSADSSSPPASAGREYSPSPNGKPATPSTPAEHAQEEVKQMPTKSFKEELEQHRQAVANNNGVMPKDPQPVSNGVHRGSLADSFPELIERETLARERPVQQEKAKSPE